MSAVVELVNVSKSFGSTRALDGVSFDVVPGEVHVLAGENGAGKSTLIKILSGALADFEGEYRLGGESVRFGSPIEAARAGIAAIHQELSLVASLSVADNLALGERAAPWSLRSPKRERELGARVLKEAGLDVDADLLVERLPIAAQQELEIARALMQGARVIVMDEPTSALGEPEAERLFLRIRELSRRGAGIVYISHRMEELFRVADRISVLRDGRLVLTAPARELDRERLVTAMVGRALSSLTLEPALAREEVALEARNVVLEDPERPGRRLLDEVSIEVRRGEILGLAGVAGSGAATLIAALFGARGRLDAGEVRLNGMPYVPESPRVAIDRGLLLLGSDRRLSLIQDLGIAENVTLSSLERWSRRGLIDRHAEHAAAAEMLAELDTRGAGELGNPVRSLSGGNQQKVALARCLSCEPRVLLLDEPTRGIDVGAKSDVYRLIRKLAEQGLAIVLVASELEELLGLARRVVVMYRGRVVDTLEHAELARERIVASAMGSRVGAAEP